MSNVGNRWTDRALFDAQGKLMDMQSAGRDITVRMQAELAAASEARYRSLYNDTPVMMHALDENGMISDVNQRWLETLGYQRDNVIGRSPLDFLTEESRQRARKNFVDLLHIGHLKDIPYQFVSNSGNSIDVLLSAHVDTDTDGCIRQISVVAIDVTERRRAEKALQQRSAQQTAVARLGQQALAGGSVQALLDAAVIALADTLNVEYCAVLERPACADVLTRRAGAGTLIGADAWGAGRDPLADYTLAQGQAVVVADWRREKRFDGKLHPSLGIHSSVSCTIVGADNAVHGVLTAHTRWLRQFTDDDVHFLETLANLISDALLRHTADIALEEQKERLRITLQSIGDAVITTDATGCVDYLNPVAEHLTDWSLTDAQGQPVATVFHNINEHTRARADNPVARCLAEGRSIVRASPSLLISRAGREYAIRASATPIRDRDKQIVGVVLVFSDVSESRELAREMSHRSAHDALTGLINRGEFERRLTRVLSSAHAEVSEHALCYLDLDQFKIVNDTCGHAAGDELLCQVSQLLGQQLRARDTLARLGGDEFAVLIEHCPLDAAKEVAHKLRRSLENFRFHWDGTTFTLGVSIGLVPIDSASDSLANVLKAADNACYAAKDAGRNRVHVYRVNDAELALRHGEVQWVSRLQQALDHDRFRLYAQAIAPITPRSSNGVHVELLLRTLDDQDRLIAPGVFLPAAERFQLASRVDSWVVNAAFHWLAAHRGDLEQLGCIAINLSGQSLGNATFQSFVLRMLKNTQLPAEKICFEITETAAITNLLDAMRFMKALRKRGCRFALDDFGSGLSSFGYLKNLPVDYLKIDGLFVKDMLDDPIDFAMVRSINEIGQLMGKQTIAEYVENDAILERLRAIGIDWAQGFGIERPQALDDWWQTHCVQGKPSSTAAESTA